MVDKVTAYKSADGTLWYNEEQAIKHDVCKELQELLAGSNHVSYSERYAFAEEILEGYPVEWYSALKIYWDYKERKRLNQVAAYYKATEAAMLMTEDWPGAEIRAVGQTPADDEVPF